MSCGIEIEANDLFGKLTAGENFTIPEIDWTKPEFNFPYDPNSPLNNPIKPLTNEDLTTRKIGGTGTFDAMMDGFKAHLLYEQEKGRITGAEYAKAYIALTEAAMANGVQFLLGRDESFWQAQAAQMQALTARIGLETARIEATGQQLQALNTKAAFALNKAKISSESITYCTAKYNLESMLPQQLLNLQSQKKLVDEQMEAQRAQTMDIRSDNLAVTGLISSQKKLYGQQIISYQRDSELKASKVFTDAWITMKTLDEGLLPPSSFTNDSINSVLVTLIANNKLG